MNRNEFVEHTLVWNLSSHAVEGGITVLVELWRRLEDLHALSDGVNKVLPGVSIGVSNGQVSTCRSLHCSNGPLTVHLHDITDCHSMIGVIF